MMDQKIIFFFAAVIIIGAAIFALICINKKGTKHLDVEHFRVRILEIEHQLKPDEKSSYHLCVINADKLVDKALIDLGIKGQTMGERMKNCSQRFSDRNGIWQAHILRNKIAHDPDVYVTYDIAKQALAGFRKALKDLGAI